jgi:hypothetical protein
MAKDKHELEAMTKDELVAYADDHDIDTQHSWLKDEIIAAILKGEKKAAKEEAKHHQDEPVHAKAHDKAKADAPASDTPMVSPEMAEIQRQANQPPDPSTAFAAGKPLEEPNSSKDK